jgi:citrate lyase beta subunit
LQSGRRLSVRIKNLAATEIAKRFVDAINAHDVDGFVLPQFEMEKALLRLETMGRTYKEGTNAPPYLEKRLRF